VPGIALIGWLRLFDSEGTVRMLLVGTVFGSLVFSLALLERRARLSMPKFWVVVGDMSYTLYLSHLLVLGVIGRIWQWLGAWPANPLDNLGFFALMFIAVLCYGWVGYHCFEKPVLDRATRFCKRHFKSRERLTT
jgi:peptidoglycan/LPS O-acetylase OafA/YrhL